MRGRRVAVVHGVNLDQLGRRPPEHYPQITLAELEVAIGRFARELDLEATFDQTNHEGEFCEVLHGAADTADAVLLNPGAWTHYSYAIRDALEIAALPAVEVHLSAVDEREQWRRHSVIADLCLARVSGNGVDGYREGLELLRAELEGRA
jgi:3-dehydroquinate dehydratase-2